MPNQPIVKSEFDPDYPLWRRTVTMATATKSPTELPPGLDPLLSIDDLTCVLSVSRRAVERLRSAGKLPRPDLHVGKLPRWRSATIKAWIERGGK